MRTVWNLGTHFTNTYLIEITEGWLLVDTGYPFDYRHFLRAAKRKGIELSSIRYVALTHVHADHAGYLKRILSDTGASLICLPAARDRLASGVNEKNVYVSRRILLPMNRLSAATPRLQTFEPVDAAGAIDPLTQPLAGEGITFFAGGEALRQCWIFVVGPFVGAILAALCFKVLDDTPKHELADRLGA